MATGSGLCPFRHTDQEGIAMSTASGRGVRERGRVPKNCADLVLECDLPYLWTCN